MDRIHVMGKKWETLSIGGSIIEAMKPRKEYDSGTTGKRKLKTEESESRSVDGKWYL